jgi:Cyclic nucleotide-binding domain/Major Facilitator Superfamily
LRDQGSRRLDAFRTLSANKHLVRVLTGYALFVVTELAVWIAMLVYAYGRGGATLAGLIAVAQLVPAAALAPIAAAASDRRSPVLLLTAGYVVQAAAMAATAAAIAGRMPVAAYVAAIIASTAVATTRPAQAAVVPAVSVTADQLTAANVVMGWLEAVGLAAAGSFVGLLIWLGGLASVFAVCAGLGAVGASLVARLRVPAMSFAGAESSEHESSLRDGLRLVVSRPGLRLMVMLLTGAAALAGALDLLIVIVAINVLGRAQAWVGYLNTAYGAGAIIAATMSVVLVGRRLGKPILGSALALCAAMALLAVNAGLAGTIVLLAVIGASSQLLSVATRTLLQRSVSPHLIGRIFGIQEGLYMAGLALGSLLVPLLVLLGGTTLALIGTAAVLPLAALACGRSLFRLNAEAPVPVVEISLLRSLRLFAELPVPVIEGLAAALTPVEVPAGDVLIRQGDEGDTYYAIAAGELDVFQDDQFLRRCGRGDGVGEIALLHDVPRSASIIARTPATVYELRREPFLTAVLGHAPTHLQASRIAETRLATRGGDHEAGPQQAGDAVPG